MNSNYEEIMKEFHEECRHLDLSTIGSRCKNNNGYEAGLKGEKSVYELLSKYSSSICCDVVVWNKRKTFVTEIDFICIIKNHLLFIEVKEWYGQIKKASIYEKIIIECVNLEGKFRRQERTNPVYSIGCFKGDFILYLKAINREKGNIKDRIFPFIVFTRENLSFDSSLIPAGSKTKMGHLNELENFLIEQSSLKDDKKEIIPNDIIFPTWDLIHCYQINEWQKAALLNDKITINGIDYKLSTIDSILFDKENTSFITILKRDGEYISGLFNSCDIKINNNAPFWAQKIDFIKLNRELHDN